VSAITPSIAFISDIGILWPIGSRLRLLQPRELLIKKPPALFAGFALKADRPIRASNLPSVRSCASCGKPSGRISLSAVTLPSAS